MSPRERVAVFSLLFAVLLINAAVLVAAAARPALAGARLLLDTLGPTDGVIFSSAEGEEEQITLRAEGGHLAWSDSPHARMYSVAFVNQQDIISKLLETETYMQDRERLTGEIQKEQEEWSRKETELREKYADFTGADDPRAEEARADFGELQAGFVEWQNTANERVNEMAVNQLKQAYQEILDAVDVVADRAGIDIVLRFTPRDAELAEGISGQTMLDIRMRSALRYPDGLDMTPEVLEEMALD